MKTYADSSTPLQEYHNGAGRFDKNLEVFTFHSSVLASNENVRNRIWNHSFDELKLIVAGNSIDPAGVVRSLLIGTEDGRDDQVDVKTSEVGLSPFETHFLTEM